MKEVAIFLVALMAMGCQKVKIENKTIDPNATIETMALFNNLDVLSEDHTLFGHQHATEYGHGWGSWEDGNDDRSDVKSVTGSHPGIIGIDFHRITTGTPEQRAREKARLKKNVVETYNRGGVTTVAWHFENPISAGGFYWKDSVSRPAVKYLIPGGESHELYKTILEDIADWAKSIKGQDGALVPVIFRPYHEFDGNWFWWGHDHCTKEEFISLWQFTVSYLRDNLDVHNFIYAYSPDNRFLTEEEFLDRYPGDEWVDMVGMDNYGEMGRDKYSLDTAALKLQIVSDYAIKHNKLAAFTETGLESIPDTTWWTDALLKTMKTYDMKLAYVLVWRNDINSPTHYYAPFPGHVSESNFLEFYRDEYTLFEKDLSEIYKPK